MADHNNFEDQKNELLKKMADFGFVKDPASVSVGEALAAASAFVDQVHDRLELTGDAAGLEQLRLDSNRTLKQLDHRSKDLQRFNEGEAHFDSNHLEQLATFRTNLLMSDILEIRPTRGSSVPILFLLYKIQKWLEGSQGGGDSKVSQLIRAWETMVTPTDFDKTKNSDLLERHLSETFEFSQVKVLTAELERLLRQLNEAKDEIIRQKAETEGVRTEVTNRDASLTQLHSQMNKLMGELLESQSQLSKLNSELEQSRMSTKDLELRERKVLEEIHIFKETVTKTTKEYEKQEDKIKFLEANIESLTQDVAIKDRELHIIRAREESFVKRGRDLADKSTLSFLKANPTAPPEANQTSFIIDPNAASGGDQSGVGNQELSGLIDNYRSAVQTFSNTVNNELLKISDAKSGRNEQLRQLDTKIRARQNEMKELSAAKVPLATNLRQSPWQTAILAFLVVIAVLHYWQSSRAPL